MKEVVRAENIVKQYGSLRAVDGVSFEVRRGECFGFLGPNGAGKTTVMRMIHCFFPPDAGRLDVLGMDVRQRPSEIKARIGVVPQDDNLDPDITVIENLLVYARYFDIPGRIRRPRAEHLLGFFGIAEKTDAYIKALSGGMKRRLVLARGLINDPELLILDEPTTGLDPLSRRTVWDNLLRLKSEDKALVLTTHSMEEAARLCDRVAIMDLGRTVEVDTPAALTARHGGTLEDVYIKLTGKTLRDAA